MSLALALAAATAAAELPPICADRPAKASGTCTVPAGKLQIETGLADWALTKGEGARASLLAIGGSTLKLGVTANSDLEAAFTPYARLKVSGSGPSSTVSGLGDLILRYKWRPTSGHAPVQVAAVPFIKLPTAAHDIGNGKLEGGVAVPIGFALAGPVSMTLGPEADLLADADGRGRHIALVNVVNVAGPIARRLTLAGELWSSFNLDPAGTVRQASADAALAFAVSNEVQLDAGANVGLTRITPDIEFYAGVAARF
jgi:hypothetical protein